MLQLTFGRDVLLPGPKFSPHPVMMMNGHVVWSSFYEGQWGHSLMSTSMSRGLHNSSISLLFIEIEDDLIVTSKKCHSWRSEAFSRFLFF